MSLEKIITTLKKPKEDMSMISINIPLSLKEQLSGISKKHGFTTNAFLVRMIDEVLNGDARDKTNLEIVEKIDELTARKTELERISLNSMNFESDEEEEIHENELRDVIMMIKILKDR